LDNESGFEKERDNKVKIYKLTDENMRTYGGFQWALGVERRIEKKGGELCSNAYFHAYEHPLLAVLHNPIHANYRNPRLFEAITDDEPLREGQMKLGVKSITLVKELPVPAITDEQRIRYAILCAKVVCDDEEWNGWADNWLSGKDRSRSAERAADAAWAAMAAERASQAASADAARVAWLTEKDVDTTLDLINIAKKAMKGITK